MPIRGEQLYMYLHMCVFSFFKTLSLRLGTRRYFWDSGFPTRMPVLFGLRGDPPPVSALC